MNCVQSLSLVNLLYHRRVLYPQNFVIDHYRGNVLYFISIVVYFRTYTSWCITISFNNRLTTTLTNDISGKCNEGTIGSHHVDTFRSK